MEKIRKEGRKKVIGDSLDLESKAPQTKHLPREFSRPSAARELYPMRCANGCRCRPILFRRGSNILLTTATTPIRFNP
jgi:hypothetical protein